jgi:hypothetical protein
MKIKINHLYKKTKNGNFHIPLFTISFGKDGFMLIILAVSIAFEINEK